jgi:predicted RecA/RadA family phage recombinase
MGLQIRSPAAQIKTVQFSDASATTSKLPIVRNGKTFIPMDDADAAALNAYAYECEISGAGKTAAQAWAVGQTLYFDPGTGLFTTAAGALTACGMVLEAKLAADTTSGLIAFYGCPL